MKLYTLVFGAGVLAGSAAAGDIQIDFPGFLHARASSVNLLNFSPSLGGASAEAVTSTGDSTRPFAVGSDTFTDFQSAATRSCNNQHNACAKIANAGNQNGGALTVGQCDAQQDQCTLAVKAGPSSSNSAASSAAVAGSVSIAATSSTSTVAALAAQGTLHSSDEQFFYFCDP